MVLGCLVSLFPLLPISAFIPILRLSILSTFVPLFALTVSRPHLLWLICCSYAWVDYSIYVVCGLSAICASSTPSTSASAMLVLSHPLFSWRLRLLCLCFIYVFCDLFAINMSESSISSMFSIVYLLSMPCLLCLCLRLLYLHWVICYSVYVCICDACACACVFFLLYQHCWCDFLFLRYKS